MSDIDLGVTLYDLNKQAMKDEVPLDSVEFNVATHKMIKDLYSRNRKYWMLLCNERRDYTILKIRTAEGMINEIRPTLLNRGRVLSIEKQKDNNYEIWIKDTDTDEVFAYYLFDYSNGVIEA